MGGDPAFQIRGVTGVLDLCVPQGAAAAHRLGRAGQYEHEGHDTAHADGRPGRFRHHGDGGSGRRGHRYGRQQKHARVREFAPTGRGLNAHHVGPLKGIGWVYGGLAGGYVMGMSDFPEL
ncbi:hypothetical protein GCM10010378_18120 [Streptomyces viridochromogenes]